jgi:hypothetical protein
MLQRAALLTLLVAASALAAPPPKALAPDAIPHTIALFLKDLSADGKHRVTFRATAYGTRFFFEEPAGVTVYSFDGGGYRKEAFLKGGTLAAAMKKYPPPKP